MAQNISRHGSRIDSKHPLLPAPTLTNTAQGVDTYPRVLSQQSRGNGTQLVVFALPGLRRARMIVPESQWLNLDHLAAHPAMMAQLSRLMPPPQPDLQPDET